jgi:hypothetical protein
MEKCAQYVSNSHHLLYFAALDNVDTCMIERVIRMLTRKERKKPWRGQTLRNELNTF